MPNGEQGYAHQVAIITLQELRTRRERSMAKETGTAIDTYSKEENGELVVIRQQVPSLTSATEWVAAGLLVLSFQLAFIIGMILGGL